MNKLIAVILIVALLLGATAIPSVRITINTMLHTATQTVDSGVSSSTMSTAPILNNNAASNGAVAAWDFLTGAANGDH